MITNLSPFISKEAHKITLNRKGHEALLGQHNVASEIDDNFLFGGINKLDYQFSIQENKLIKTIQNAH